MNQVLQQKFSPTQTALNEIETLIRARYSILYLLTFEEARLVALLADIANKQSKHLYVWTATEGLREHTEAHQKYAELGDYRKPIEILNHIQLVKTDAIFLLKDFHAFMEDPQVIRRLRDAAQELHGTYKNILIVSPRLNLPVDLEKDITLIDIPLPDTSELFDLLKSVCTAVAAKSRAAMKLTPEDSLQLAKAAQGLTLSEAENAFSKAVANDGLLQANDISVVLNEKKQIIRKSGILEFYPSESSLQSVGGLENLKSWLTLRGSAFSSEASKFGLPAPKGVLLLGAPGCGKSLTAKAISTAWQMPLLKLDFGKIFSSFVGNSEENMRRALKVAEGIAPAILWIDEIEKGLAGSMGHSSTSDGGVGARVFGTFLTWMQEKKSTVFVVATANKIEALPPELLRRGRFDEIFFIDLPKAKARAEIFTIHLKNKKRSADKFAIQQLVQITEGFSGSEIEHVITEGLYKAFNQGRELVTEDIVSAVKETIPLSVTYAEELQKNRHWAHQRARQADSTAGET